LQQFLGVSPATGYYGSITQSSVEGWQAANNIISYGTPATTGYGVVGPRTAAAIRLACSGGSTAGTGSSNSGTGVVSGFLQVAPVSGAAPLTSTVTATVNTAASCTGATYTLNYGDGTPGQTIVAPAGNCSQQNESFQHTYQYGGSYTVTLSSGPHSTTATVTVSGQSNTSVTAPADTTQASGSMSAFITSGPAPLATTFYVSCAAGLAYDVVFGDGTDLGSTGVSQSNCNGGLQSVAHTYTSVGSYNAQLLVFIRNSQGTISSQGVAQQGITVTGNAPSSPANTSSTYAPPTVTPDVGSNPLAVSLAFQIGACASYSIQWGDGQTAPGTGPCGGSTNTSQSISHTYAASGSYTVTLTRGSQSDTVGVSISN
jgi:PKD repeat protein